MVREEPGGGGGVGEDLSLTMYFLTVGPTQIYTSQPFSLHCNKKFIHAAGDHHGQDKLYGHTAQGEVEEGGRGGRGKGRKEEGEKGDEVGTGERCRMLWGSIEVQVQVGQSECSLYREEGTEGR